MIELRLKGGVPRKTVERVVSRMRKAFARTEEMKEVKLRFESATESTNVESSFGGVRLYSESGNDIVWIRTNGLAISRLPPYCGWKEFSQAARIAWQHWLRIAGDNEIGRLGLRYINRIDIPVTENNRIRLEDYLAIYPHFPDENQIFNAYTLQAVLPIGSNFQLTVNTGSAPQVLINHISYLLDLDVGRETDTPQTEEGIWQLLDEMRDHKNRIFESFITDKTRSLFDQ